MKNSHDKGLYIAFDIGTSSIKAAVVEITDSGKRLSAVEEEILKSAGDFPSSEEYYNYTVTALQSIASRLPVNQCRNVSALFSNRELQVKVIELPNQIREDQIGQIVGWEAKKLLAPAYQDESYAFAYKVIRHSPYLVAIAVVPERFLLKFIQLFDDAKIELGGIYGEVFGADALKDAVSDASQQPSASIVNLGSSGTHLEIFTSGELRFYRYIPSGIAEMSLPPENSELEMFAQKIRFSFDYFRAVSKLAQIDSLYFMGGGVVPENVLTFAKEYFAPSKTGIVDISESMDISPILSCSSASIDTPENKQRMLLPFIPAIGAILCGTAKQSETMNLMSFIKKQRHSAYMKSLSKLLPAVIALAGIIISALILYAMRCNLTSEREAAVKAQMIAKTSLDISKVKLERLQTSQKAAVNLPSQAKNLLAPLTDTRIFPHHLLYLIATNTPEGLSVDELLVRTTDEMQKITLPVIEENTGNEYTEETVNPYLSKIDQNSGETDSLKEGIVGTGLIILGTAESNDKISLFVKKISASGLCRCKGVLSRKRGSSIEFLIKGELP